MQEEFSQPFLKPPHLDQPLSTLLLSESTMAFGRILMSENDGNYKGPLMLPLKQGYLSNNLYSLQCSSFPFIFTILVTLLDTKAENSSSFTG